MKRERFRTDRDSGVRETARESQPGRESQRASGASAALRFGRLEGGALPMRSSHLGCRIRFSGLWVFHVHYRRGISQRRLRD